MTKQQSDHLYGKISEEAENKYHSLFLRLGETQDSKSQNFHCWNSGAHSDGVDEHGSLSIDNVTGKWLCHACTAKGNFASYYKDYVASSPNDKWDGKFLKFGTELLGIPYPNDDDDARSIEQAESLLRYFTDKISTPKPVEQTKPTENKEPVVTIPKEQNDWYVHTLLAMPSAMNYLKDYRFIKEDTVEKYRIGFSTKDNCLTFPQIDPNGDITNVKMYRPWNPDFKWQAMVKGNGFNPAPVIHLTHQKLYIFEGEPDTYCAAAHGLYGITSGGVSKYSYKKIYGDQFENMFLNKEIVLVMDADDKGIIAAAKIAEELYGVVKQIKIIDLNKSSINPNGLDPSLVKLVKKKEKRTEKDFTDFMRKNGFGEAAVHMFVDLELATPVYNQNVQRGSVENFKVAFAECTNSRYYDKDSKKRLEVVASIEDFDQKIYKYPTKVCVSCKPLFDLNMKHDNMCKKCRLSTIIGFGNGSVREVSYNIIRMSSLNGNEVITPFDVIVREGDLLALIQTTDEKLKKMKKQILDIPEKCSDVRFIDEAHQSLQHVNLKRDPDEMLEETTKSMRDKASSRENSFIEAFLLGDHIIGKKRICVNKSYRLHGVQVVVPNKQNAALFCYDVVPMEESFESFRMNDNIYETLKVFRPASDKPQDIEKHLSERYKTFGNAAGINGREDLFFVADLAYFSPTVLNNPQVLPAIKRGWVEVLIAGDARCGKSIVGGFLLDHYRIGYFVNSSDGVTRTGLVGGVVMSFGSKKIQWGCMPQNDNGIVIIDELSRIDHDGLDSITALRSDGWAQIEKIASGQVSARVRKICFSNWRGWRDEDIDTSAYGIELIRKLCFEDSILARFDVATVVKAGDVKSFDCKYENISSKFTSLQCRNLIQWAYSRKPEQIKFEAGFAEMLNRGQEVLLKRFHPTTQLVNQEMRAKLCRLAISLATMTFSTDPEDWNIIYVKCSHVEYVTDFLTKIYSHKNMGMVDFSDEKWYKEKLGDMRFMMNILEYVNIDAVIQFKEGNERDICHIFSDYLVRVSRGKLSIVDGKDDSNPVSCLKAMELSDKFIGLLRARNCIIKGNFNKYHKTEAFADWLKHRKDCGNNVERSNILQGNVVEPDNQLSLDPRHFVKNPKSETTRINN